MSRYTYAWFAVLAVTVLWASSLIFAKIVFVELPPIAFVWHNLREDVRNRQLNHASIGKP